MENSPNGKLPTRKIPHTEICPHGKLPIASSQSFRSMIFEVKDSIITRSGPQDWRIANVVPIFKKGTKIELGNYRLVSLTSTVGKILRDAMLEYLKRNSLMTQYQHRFTRDRSCHTNLISFYEEKRLKKRSRLLLRRLPQTRNTRVNGLHLLQNLIQLKLQTGQREFRFLQCPFNSLLMVVNLKECPKFQRKTGVHSLLARMIGRLLQLLKHRSGGTTNLSSLAVVLYLPSSSVIDATTPQSLVMRPDRCRKSSNCSMVRCLDIPAGHQLKSACVSYATIRDVLDSRNQDSIITRSGPQDWRIANVVPIFKKGTKIELGNYRLVSLTSTVGKILRDAMLEYLKRNSLMTQYQHRFTRDRSCHTNLISFYEEKRLKKRSRLLLRRLPQTRNTRVNGLHLLQNLIQLKLQTGQREFRCLQCPFNSLLMVVNLKECPKFQRKTGVHSLLARMIGLLLQLLKHRSGIRKSLFPAFIIPLFNS
ncbi:unnamed protein product [Ranitomeya imitator]|uniref:Reverse transcriptase domain-containing protein n=1 Tax=Ranitomeya imitator TaxID=111125 RepID=A0ABN9L8R1_9NEOB|nr:unnamed protein product [Ranitomeya imitator]